MPKPFFQKSFERWLAANKARLTHPPKVTRRRRNHASLSFRGITPRIKGYITRHGVGIEVLHEGDCVDLLIDLEVGECRRPDGRYFCDQCLEPEVFDSRQALWEEHCFEPLLEWANQHLRAGQWLHLYIREGFFSHAAIMPGEISDDDAAGWAEGEYKGAWPVVAMK